MISSRLVGSSMTCLGNLAWALLQNDWKTTDVASTRSLSFLRIKLLSCIFMDGNQLAKISLLLDDDCIENYGKWCLQVARREDWNSRFFCSWSCYANEIKNILQSNWTDATINFLYFESYKMLHFLPYQNSLHISPTQSADINSVKTVSAFSASLVV